MTIQELHSVFLKHQLVCTDTRKITKDAIFFALKGENFNGNKFAHQALELGCAYAVVDEKEYASNEKYILVNDVLETLQQLAIFHRKYWGGANDWDKIVIGLTGSNGKTTTKELIHAVLKPYRNCLATVGNLNNHIGVPLTILALKPEHDLAIIEMGANHQGEISALCKIAQPNFGIITNVGKAHLEGFGGEEGVLKGKGEMYDYIRSTNGRIFINGDDEKLMSIAGGITAYKYGLGNTNFVHGKILENNVFLEMEICDSNECVHVQTQLTGTYNALNVLCAFMVGYTFDLEMKDIVKGLETYAPDNSRSQVVKTLHNTLILDAYNANPSSMTFALENLARIDAPRKMFVLGDMREMGNHAKAEHRAILEKIVNLNLKGVLVGEEFSSFKNEYDFQFFYNAGDALKWLNENKVKNNLVLIKGSRGLKLETVVPAF